MVEIQNNFSTSVSLVAAPDIDLYHYDHYDDVSCSLALDPVTDVSPTSVNVIAPLSRDIN